MFADSLKELRSRQPQFFRMLHNFNFNPASYLHPSRRSDFFGGSLPDRVWEESRVVHGLSAQILEDMNLLTHPCLDFPHQKWSLALLSPDRLARLASHVGAVVMGSKVRASLAREQVIAWKDKLGTDAYQFVVNSAQLLPVMHANPGTFMPEHAKLIGYKMIAQSLNEAPKSMQLRAMLKIPVVDPGLTGSDNAAQIVHTVMVILEAEWHSLFVVKKH